MKIQRFKNWEIFKNKDFFRKIKKYTYEIVKKWWKIEKYWKIKDFITKKKKDKIMKFFKNNLSTEIKNYQRLKKKP